MSDTQRYFLAVFPPPEAQAAAAEACGPLRSPGDGVSWVKRDNLHYTLRFLGDLGADGAHRALLAALEAASVRGSFAATLGAFGAFPSPRRARVLWLGLAQGSGALCQVASALDTALVRHGFGPADRPFAPHLTVGRTRVPADWTAKLSAARAPQAAFAVDRVLLVRSRLSPRGSIYERVDEAKLGG